MYEIAEICWTVLVEYMTHQNSNSEGNIVVGTGQVSSKVSTELA